MTCLAVIRRAEPRMVVGRVGLVALAGLLAVVGCDSSPRVVPLDAVAQPLSIDVSVTPAAVTIYPNATDQVCACDDEMAHFAEPGACIDIDDELLCHCTPPSCLSIELTGTGVGAPPLRPSYPMAFQLPLPDPLPSDLMLHLGGCGHPDIAIPIEPFTAPTPTVTADVVDALVTAHWQTDQPAASAYVQFSFYTSGHDCHTTAHDVAYTHFVPLPPDYGSVIVTTFLPVQTVASPNREIRIWRGNFGFTRL